MFDTARTGTLQLSAPEIECLQVPEVADGLRNGSCAQAEVSPAVAMAVAILASQLTNADVDVTTSARGLADKSHHCTSFAH